jgi:uncharacterized protein with GYD domain
MAFFMLQWTYKDSQIKAMVDAPHDRSAELRKVVEGFGGRLHQFFFAFGEYDGVAIVEFPDNESCVAAVLTIAGAGPNSSFKTTVLVPTGEAENAMRRARMAQTGYMPPVGYASIG